MPLDRLYTSGKARGATPSELHVEGRSWEHGAGIEVGHTHGSGAFFVFASHFTGDGLTGVLNRRNYWLGVGLWGMGEFEVIYKGSRRDTLI